MTGLDFLTLSLLLKAALRGFSLGGKESLHLSLCTTALILISLTPWSLGSQEVERNYSLEKNRPGRKNPICSFKYMYPNILQCHMHAYSPMNHCGLFFPPPQPTLSLLLIVEEDSL